MEKRIDNPRESEKMDTHKITMRLPSFLSPGWWIIHLLGIATIYILGHLLWR